MSVINAENENAPRKNMYSLAVRNADDESWVKLEYFDETVSCTIDVREQTIQVLISLIGYRQLPRMPCTGICLARARSH
jgi:hypothetical protein